MKMRTPALFFLFVICTGCTQGFIYDRTTRPLTTNFNQTPFGSDNAHGSTKQVTFQVEAKWDTNGIGEIAREHGLEEVYFADIETFRILQFWEKNTVRVYGK